MMLERSGMKKLRSIRQGWKSQEVNHVLLSD